MDSIKVSTPQSFSASPSSPKRKKHTTIACEPCRKLKIRCLGGEATAINSSSVTAKSCNHCASLSKECVWPQEDGRKRGRPSSPRNAREDNVFKPRRNENSRLGSVRSLAASTPPLSTESSQALGVRVDHGISPTAVLPKIDRGMISLGERSDSSASETPYTTVHYYRHLGPTAIAPGHKKISLKARHDYDGESRHPSMSSSSHVQQGGLLPLFDSTGLPVAALLPTLLDSFFRAYLDNMFFVNRRHLNSLISKGKGSVFLICAMSTLSSRFCPPERFIGYLPPKADGSSRESWEYSIPFLQQTKSMLVAAIDLPSTDVVAGLLMLSYGDFGDNNEAGLWTFAGMAIRMAQELGLHREQSCLDIGPEFHTERDLNVEASKPRLQPADVDLKEFENSAKVMLFWCVFIHDTCLCSGTGRVPSIKRHEVNIRLPSNEDIATIRAGPGGVAEPSRPEVYPHTARMMLEYAKSIDFLNTGSSQIRFQSDSDCRNRMDRIEGLKRKIIEEYRLLPKEIGYGAVKYQAAVKANQAGPYLSLHLFYHLQIAFLTQESLAGDDESLVRPPDRTVTNEEPIDERLGLDIRKVNQELYRNAIKSITDMLTFAKLIDDGALLTTIFINQSFFHAACAYSRDMLRGQNKGKTTLAKDLSPSAFPIPSRTSPSMVFQFDETSGPHAASTAATESAYSFLSLIAKANYQFLRQAIKDQARIYAGSGWLDAVLEQRETGLRDVDLSVVSESISTFIRLHDLREPGGSESALQKFVPSSSGNDRSSLLPESDNVPTDFQFLADTELNFDPQAFFDNYMFTELANQNGYGSEPTDYGSIY